MRARGSILLVSCYELGHQPAGLFWPIAFLERAGYQPEAIDISVGTLDIAKVRRARFAGISAPMHTALRLGARVASRIREVNPDCHICFYGTYAGLNSGYLLATWADSTIAGECEESMVALVGALERRMSIEEVAGVSVPGRASTPALQPLKFPLPSRAALPALEKYAHLEWGVRRVAAGYVEATRGCLHHCSHCPIPPVFGGKLFVVPTEIVLADVAQQVAEGACHVTFGDPDFLNGPTHSLRIVRRMHSRFPSLTFDFTAKIEHLLKHRALLPEFRRMGCAFVVTAAESLSNSILSRLAKGHTRSEVVAALEAVRRSGIAFRPTWVAFTPWTTPGDYLEMLDFIEAEGLIENVDAVQYAVRLLIPPGSGLLAQLEMTPHLGKLDEASFSFPWTHPDAEMDALFRNVSASVERSLCDKEDATKAFCRVRALARAVAGAKSVSFPMRTAAGRRPDSAPRLTEAWFC